MKLTDVIAHFGGSYRDVAEKIGVGHTVLTNWKKNGIPLSRQAMIEIQTNGALKADMPAQQFAKTA